MELLVLGLKWYVALGLSTFIQFVWFYRGEIFEDIRENWVACSAACFMTCLECVIKWPKIQWMNVFGGDDENPQSPQQ